MNNHFNAETPSSRGGILWFRLCASAPLRFTFLLFLFCGCQSVPAATNTLLKFSVRTPGNAPIANCLIAITALDSVVSDGETNTILGRTVQVTTSAAGLASTNLVPGPYLFQFRSTIPFFQANNTNIVPASAVAVNYNDLLTNGTFNLSGVGYSQAQSDARYLGKTNASGAMVNAGKSNVLIAPRIFTSATPSPTAIGQVLAYADTNGTLEPLAISGAGDVTTSQLNASSNSLFLQLTNFDIVNSNLLYAMLTNRIALTSNGLWSAASGLIAATTNGLYLIVTNLNTLTSNGVFAASSNVTYSATNNLNTARQAILNASNALYVTRFNAVEASIAAFLRSDDINNVDETTFALSDGGGNYFWHVDINDGFNGASNPDLVSAIGHVETLTGKTLTAPTINGGTQNGGTYNTPTLNTATLNGPSISSPSFVGGLTAQLLVDPQIVVRTQNAPATTNLWFQSIGGSNGFGVTMRVAQSRPGASGAREWNFGWFSENLLVYSNDANTIAVMGDVAAPITTRSNGLPAAVVAVSGSPYLFTNLTGASIHVLLSGGALQGVGVNGKFWCAALTNAAVPVPLQTNEWISVTNTSVPQLAWKPY